MKSNINIKLIKESISPWLWWVCCGSILLFIIAGAIYVSRPYADQVFLYYLAEKDSGGSLLANIALQIQSIPGYLSLGVFRPISRMLFVTEHWILFRIGNFYDISPYTLASFVKIGSAIALISSSYFLVRQYVSKIEKNKNKLNSVTNSIFTMILLFFISMMVINAPSSHPANIFSLLYLGTASFSIYAAVIVGYLSYKKQSKLSMYSSFIILFIIGAVASSSIELAYLAIPISGIHVFLLHIAGSNKVGVRSILFSFIKTKALLYWVVLTVGFLSVLIPTRSIARDMCTEQNTCYRNAELSIDSEMLSIIPKRAVSVYNSSLRSILDIHLIESSVFILSIAILITLSIILLYKFRSRYLSSKKYMPVFILMFTLFISILIFGALIGASSSTLHDASKLSSRSWRDTSHIWFASASLLPIFILLITGLIKKIKIFNKNNLNKILYVLTSITVVVCATSAAISNYSTYKKGVEVDPLNAVLNDTMNQFIYFDNSKLGENNRCSSLEPILEMKDILAYRRVLDSVNPASKNIHGKPYCNQLNL